MSAKDALRRMIEADGPITVAQYMSFCLTHPRHGYYATRDPFGTAGDFVTAPEISQMFGELIGLWVASVWLTMGAPAPLRLTELGPGRGTLMADALRAIGQVPQLRDCGAEVHLVEISPALRERQRAALAASGAPLAWHDDVSALPDQPLIVIANEFFDALPIRQAVRTATGWHERMIGLDAAGNPAFGLAPHPLAAFAPPVDAKPDDLFEWRDDRIARDLAARVTRNGGAVLLIDYGHAQSGCGDTLQAVQRHAFADVLATPGEADITAHVDFAALGRAARAEGAAVFGPVEQGAFLNKLGIAARAERLQAAAPAQAVAVAAARDRLTGRGERQMGALFKVMAFAHPSLALPGFDSTGVAT